jgi:sec-independent protein translocase protein TatA
LFGSLGAPELVAIFILALVLFGPKKLPELGRALGKSFAEFRRASLELRSTLEKEIAESERPVEPTLTPSESVARVPDETASSDGEKGARGPA